MNIEGLLITPTKIISTIGGDVFHAMKKSDLGYAGFGEAYFSTIEPNAIKAWKCHREMVLNILVPIGEVKFILYDDRPKSKTNGNFLEVVLSQKNYQRLINGESTASQFPILNVFGLLFSWLVVVEKY